MERSGNLHAKYTIKPQGVDSDDLAKLYEGVMWPTSFALKNLTAAEEVKIAALVKKAVS